MRSKVLFAAALFSLSIFAFAGPGHHTPPKMPKQFDVLKKLVGTWEGKTKMGDKEEEMRVSYTLTSGGTAVEEKLFPGHPHEMVSMYHLDGKSLGMTHYCAMGNQPHMKLKNATANSLAFEMKQPIGISSIQEPHMHAVTLTLVDDKTLKQEWTNFEKGKKKDTAVFTFTKQ